MRTLTFIQAVASVCLSSCGPEETHDRKSGTQLPVKVADSAQRPVIMTPEALTRSTQTEMPAPTHSRETAQKIMQRRKSADFETASTQFGEFLQENGVIGKPIAEVKAVLGTPDAETSISISYRFEAGFGGWDWILNHDGKNILGFSRNGVD